MSDNPPMSLPPRSPRPNPGPALLGAALAVILSVPLAAVVAAQLSDTYETRALVYTGFLLWAVVGAVVVFMRTYEGERGGMGAARVLKWMISIWLWPLIALAPRRKPEA